MCESDDGNKIVRTFLDAMVDSTSTEDRLANDPIGLVRAFEDPADQEVVALIASTLAYGRVDLVRDAIRRALIPLGPNPAQLLADTAPDDWFEPLERYVYRMTRGPDLADLFAALGDVLRTRGSLEALYAAEDGPHIERASAFVQALRAGRRRPELTRGLRYLLVDPADGSAAKRLNMFFRWVVRGPDAVDLGLWSCATPSELVMPLDTHTSRIARYIGLTGRAATDLRTAIEVTDSLRALHPSDPLRYDFALAHLGIAGRCIHRRSDAHCPGCPLEPVCQL